MKNFRKALVCVLGVFIAVGAVLGGGLNVKANADFNIISDDFNASALDTSLWTIVNPRNDAAFAMAGAPDAMLSIAIPAGISHDIRTGGNYAPRVMQSANNTDFEIDAKFQSQLTSQYQMQGIIVEQDNNNYLRLEIYRDAATTRALAVSFKDGVPTVRYDSAIPSGNSLYLRVNRTGDQWTQYYSYDGANWTSAANFNHPLIVASVGPYAGNYATPESSSPAFTGLIDYFFNTLSPIVPEDGPIFNLPFIAAQPTSQEIVEGQTATFNVTATGSDPLIYQWQKNNINIPDAISQSYTTPATTLSDNNSTFRVIVTNFVGSATSDSATLTVIEKTPAPAPINFIANPGFESGTASWNFYTNAVGSFTAGAPAYIGTKTAKVNLVTSASNMQLYQTGISLEPNTKYKLSFAAYSSTGHDMGVNIFKHGSPYTNYGLSYTTNLGTSWQTFTAEFTSKGFTGNISDARLMFSFMGYAQAGDVYYIDDVVLEKVE